MILAVRLIVNGFFTPTPKFWCGGLFAIMKDMCLATPSKIVKIDGDWATVQSGDHNHKANLSLVKNAKAGDYVIVHGDLVLNKIEKEDALKILNLLKKTFKIKK